MITAFIPARSGSKSILNKNQQRVGDMSLVQRSLLAASACEYVSSIVISTDSSRIVEEVCNSDVIVASSKPSLEIDRRLVVLGHTGSQTVYLHVRRIEDAGDDSKTIDAVLDFYSIALEYNFSPAFLLLLQPTSPFRLNSETKKIVELFLSNPEVPLVSVVRALSPHPDKTFQISSDNIACLDSSRINTLSSPRQNLVSKYALDGAYYLASLSHLLSSRSFLSEQTRVFVREGVRTINIDTNMDLKFAKFVVSSLRDQDLNEEK